jgi:hypothetical protein
MRFFFAVGLLLLTNHVFSQRYDCVKTKSLTSHDLVNVFPFNKSATIELVSYNSVLEDSISPFAIKGRVDKSKLVEQKVLNQNQIDGLVDILYYYTFDPKLDSIDHSVAGCFWPRNAFVFKNKKGRAVARIEVCFACWHAEFYPERFKPVDFCNGKMDMLLIFMENAGIQFGVERPAGIKKSPIYTH